MKSGAIDFIAKPFSMAQLVVRLSNVCSVRINRGRDGMPAVPVSDLLGGWAAATAILAALLERGRTGRGSVIDAPLLDAGGELLEIAHEKLERG